MIGCRRFVDGVVFVFVWWCHAVIRYVFEGKGGGVVIFKVDCYQVCCSVYRYSPLGLVAEKCQIWGLLCLILICWESGLFEFEAVRCVGGCYAAAIAVPVRQCLSGPIVAVVRPDV